MGVLNTDSGRLRSAAMQLDQIKTEVLSALGRYVTMNQDLNGAGFSGTASLASLRTTEDIAQTGRQVSNRFEQIIDAMRTGADEYDRVEHENQAAVSSIHV